MNREREGCYIVLLECNRIDKVLIINYVSDLHLRDNWPFWRHMQ